MTTGLVRRVLAFILAMALLLGPATPAGAVVAGQLRPGESFDTAGQLGLTGTDRSETTGIALETNDDKGYYFYFKLGQKMTVDFRFETYQPVLDYQGRLKSKIILLSLYDANKKATPVKEATQKCAASKESPSGKLCTATLTYDAGQNQAYFLWVNFHIFDDRQEGQVDSKSYPGWLTWTVGKGTSGFDGSSRRPLPWLHRAFVHGKIDAALANAPVDHWYRLTVAAGTRSLDLSLWGGKDSNLDLAVYPASSTRSPLVSSTRAGSNYPEKVTVPLNRTDTVLVKVTNQGKTVSEYTLSYLRR
jgi:hypothetical protein